MLWPKCQRMSRRTMSICKPGQPLPCQANSNGRSAASWAGTVATAAGNLVEIPQPCESSGRLGHAPGCRRQQAFGIEHCLAAEEGADRFKLGQGIDGRQQRIAAEDGKVGSAAGLDGASEGLLAGDPGGGGRVELER